MTDWESHIDLSQSVFTKYFKPYDPFHGLPRKAIKGTHPRKAWVYMRVYHLLSRISKAINSFGEWVDFKAEDFAPPRAWSDHSEVDWDQVSPEEKKRRTTITWSFSQPTE